MDLSNIALSVVMNHSVCEEINMMRKGNKLLRQFINNRKQIPLDKNLGLFSSCIDILMPSSNTALSVVLNQSVCKELKYLREENKVIKNCIKNINVRRHPITGETFYGRLLIEWE